ncbi:unnamed protein product, partial [Mesorhabditis belari]|uniref:WASH complex subunit 7 n=1 Tax=Mesorhabditis belari TaxID=2138241 RepID=A0AAF3F4C3_9BILA
MSQQSRKTRKDQLEIHIDPSSLFAKRELNTLDKCILTFSTLGLEADRLINEAINVHFPAILLYEENDLAQSAVISQIGFFLPTLNNFAQFLGNVLQVFRNLLQQIRAFYSLSNTELQKVGDWTLTRSWRTLGDLLSILMQTDEILLNHDALKRDWNLYRKSLETAQHNPSQFDVSVDELRPLLIALTTIDAQLMHGDALRNCYEQSFGELDDDQKFRDRMKSSIIDMYSQWEATAVADVPDKRQLTSLICLGVFYHLHFGGKDKKVVKTLWNSHKKIVAFHLIGNIVWLPCWFILREIPEMRSLVDKKSLQFVQTTKESLYKEQSSGMIAEAHAMCTDCEAWEADFRLQLEPNGRHSTRHAADCIKLADLVLKGARLCDTMCRLLRTVLHSEAKEKRMTKSDSIKIFQVIQSIKSIARLFTKKWSIVLEVCQMAAHQYRCNALLIVGKGRTTCRESGEIERLNAWNVAAEALLSTDSRSRLLVAGIALEMGVYKKVLRSAEATQLEQLLTRIDTLGRPRKLITKVTDCSFLYWERSIFSLYFDSIIDIQPTREQIECFVCTIGDCAALTSRASHVADRALLRRFQNDIYHSMQKGLLYTMCGDIENDLRILIHKHLAVDEKDKISPRKFAFYKNLLKDPQIRLFDRVLDVREFVERYLEKTFYNLTVVALHDRHTYTRMAGLAFTRYQLQLIDGHLPHFNLDQGLDVISVMKNLGQFVTSYNYSLNQQVFIEKDSASKFLRVLSAQHVANSLRSHGTGVLNTAVNITYQLLRKKMAIVSQFLAEEHVKAQLQREVRYFEENGESLQRLYPVKRAEKFNRAITQLGMEGEESYLDKFRQIVTQIGNALGVVRALTTAAALEASQAKQSDVDESDLPLTDPTQQTPEIFTVVKDLLKEVREQTGRNRNYIKMLINVFRSGFADQTKYSHLAGFYAVIPPLTVNYVEHMLTCRERLRKRSQQGKEITFTDDGFVMGIAYLCTVFEQWRSLAALNWFTAVLKRCGEEREKLNSDETPVGDQSGVKALRSQRLNAYEKEFKLLAYTLQSARIFYFSENDDQHLVT